MTVPADDPAFAVDPARIESNWRSISAALDAPRPGVLERLLRTVGLPPHATRLVVATPALRRAWWVAMIVVLLVGLGTADAADPRESLLVFLLAAPLVPLLGVALAFGPGSDPSHESMLATPMTGLRVLAVRTATVLAVSLIVIAPLALLSETARTMAFAWVLPAFAVTAATVALMTALSPRRAATVVSIVWIVGVLAVRAAATDPIAAFGLAGQLASILVVTVAGAFTVARRDRLDTLAVVR